MPTYFRGCLDDRRKNQTNGQSPAAQLPDCNFIQTSPASNAYAHQHWQTVVRAFGRIEVDAFSLALRPQPLGVGE